MSTTSTDKVAAIEVMEKAVEKIGEVITEEKGDMTVKMAVGRLLFLMSILADTRSQRSFPRRMMLSSRL